MKVIGINGSSRRDGNTAIMIRKVFEELEKECIETELVQLAGERIGGRELVGNVLRTEMEDVSSMRIL